MSQPPLPVDYRSSQPRRGWPLGLQMLTGLGLGTLVSVIVWVGGWKYVENSGANLLVLVPATKLIVGVVLLCIRGWRGFGGGILLSIAIGFLIFFGACAAHFQL